MDHFSFIDGLMARLQGPMRFRFLMQPLMAFFLAFRDGRRDAREGKPPFFWCLCRDREQRREMLLSGCKSIAKVFTLAIILDWLFQYIVFHEYRPGAALTAAIVLALIPYLLLRGPVNRMTRRRMKRVKS